MANVHVHVRGKVAIVYGPGEKILDLQLEWSSKDPTTYSQMLCKVVVKNAESWQTAKANRDFLDQDL